MTWRTLDPRVMEAWVRTRPEKVQALLREFPIGTSVTVGGREWAVMGATESDMLVIFPVDVPDYDDAMERRQHLHAAHLRDGSIPANTTGG